LSRLTDMLSFLARRQAWPVDLPKVWDSGRPSIFEFLQARPVTAGSDNEIRDLPDDDIFHRGEGEIRWAAGARDGVGSHHAGQTGKAERAVLSALAAASKAPSTRHLKALYSLLLQEGTLDFIDPVLSAIRSDPPPYLDGIHKIAVWLATQSPDREPVKFGIALLGIFDEVPGDLLLALGRHDEFTLYSAVALANSTSGEARDMLLWRLAKQVHGWGRIHCVERLVAATNPDIKAWLLREGYRNSILYDYLAYACATGGDLAGALRAERPDTQLLKGAGDILVTLIGGGPAEDFSSYAEGAEATRLYVDHMTRETAADLDHFLNLSRLKDFLDDTDRDWTELEPLGWSPEARQSISAAAAEIIRRPGWTTLVDRGLQASDSDQFWSAAQAARHLGRDIWEIRFARQEAGQDSQWYFLLDTEDSARAARVVELALRHTDLTRAGAELGIGTDDKNRAGLDSILQSLGSFPGLGWPLIAAGLRSPKARNQFTAVRALGEWGHEALTPEMTAALREASALQADEELRDMIRQVLAGESLE